jgi:hypothetical protein
MTAPVAIEVARTYISPPNSFSPPLSPFEIFGIQANRETEYISFLKLIQIDEMRTLHKYVVPTAHIPVGFLELFLCSSPKCEPVFKGWDTDDHVIKYVFDGLHRCGTIVQSYTVAWEYFACF